jgi:hypothetical protein
MQSVTAIKVQKFRIVVIVEHRTQSQRLGHFHRINCSKHHVWCLSVSQFQETASTAKEV